VTRPTLFPIFRRQGALKHALGRVLALANAGAAGWQLGFLREEFYGLKRKLLEAYGERAGTDWQEITRPCWGCGDCRDYDEDLYYCGRRDGFACGGSKVYSRKWIPLARWKLGATTFHTPGPAVFEDPGQKVTFRGRVPHREVKEEDAHAAFLQLALWFDRPLFERVVRRRLGLPEEIPF
jgi:hypothetical protein